MLEAIGGKILAGIMSLSMFLFSSYTGNDPSLRPLSGFVNNSYLQINSFLDNAFDNDFGDVFKSGTQITVFYKVELRTTTGVVYKRTYQNSVVYDAMRNNYRVAQSGTGQSFTTTSFSEVVEYMSSIAFSVPVEKRWVNVSTTVEAWLPTVNFPQINRNVDLMVLWKFRKPNIKGDFNVRHSS